MRHWRDETAFDVEDIESRVWASPAFAVPKKNGDIRLVIDFRKLNEWLKWKECPLPLIENILTSIRGFNLASVIDLNMGYLSTPLTEESKKLLTIVTPFGFYECQVLPMGVMPATDIFQSRMVDIFAAMIEDEPDPYIGDILQCQGANFEEHLAGLDEILRRLKEAGMQVNLNKSSLCAEEVEFWASR